MPPDVVLRRVGRLADGWCPNFPPGEEAQKAVALVEGYAREAGRNPGAVGLEGRLRVAVTQPEDWQAEARAWERLGASHLCVETRRAGLNSVEDHIDAFRRVKEVLV